MLRIPIEVSARHIHLTEAHIQKLFGHSLTVLKPISQTGQFAAKETISLFTVHCSLPSVRVVGPARKESQVELSLSDCRALGLTKVPIKVSGSLAGSPGIVVIGPKGRVILKRGVIVPERHIHCPASQAKKLGLQSGQRVGVCVSGKRGLVFENVVVRVRQDFVWSMHLDTDEANAAGIRGKAVGTVVL